MAITSTDLVERAAAGDAAAWEGLVDACAAEVWSVVTATCSGADADTAFRLTWLRLVEHLGRLPRSVDVDAWLRCTAQRESRSVLAAHDGALWAVRTTPA